MNNFLELLMVKAYANLRTEVSRYYLNYLWWTIEPVLTMITFYIVFGIFLNRGTEHYVAFLLTGLVPWQWFSNGVNQAAGSVLDGRGLMLQVNIPKLFFPLEIILRGTFKHFFVLALLLTFLVLYPTPVSETWFALPILMAIQLLYIVAVGTFCAAIIPFLPDLKFVVASVLELMMFASGVFYQLESVVLPRHQTLAYMNPMAGLIKNYRDVLMYAKWPDWSYLAMLTGYGVVFLAVSLLLLYKFDHMYPRVCQR